MDPNLENYPCVVHGTCSPLLQTGRLRFLKCFVGAARISAELLLGYIPPSHTVSLASTLDLKQ